MGTLERQTALARVRRLRAAIWQAYGDIDRLDMELLQAVSDLVAVNGAAAPWPTDPDRLMLTVSDEGQFTIVEVEPTDGFTQAYYAVFDENGRLLALNCVSAEPLLRPDM